MREKTIDFLVEADETIADTRTSLGVALTAQAARLSYLAAFHAAQALIMETTGAAAKIHKEVHVRFAELANVRGLDKSYARFSSAAYHFKEAADYETGGLRRITESDARQAIERADDFVSRIKVPLENQP